MDMGQCNDAYGAIQVAVALADAFGCSVNELPLSFVLSWYEQKAVCILLTLLHLSIKNIRLRIFSRFKCTSFFLRISFTLLSSSWQSRMRIVSFCSARHRRSSPVSLFQNLFISLSLCFFCIFVNYSVTELPEHLKSGGIPSFFRVRPWHQYCLPFGYTATFIIYLWYGIRMLLS